MDRVLEPEYMDTQDEASEYDAMDHAQANANVVADLKGAGAAGFALDLGTGPGDIPILLAQECPRVLQITAVDAAETMLAIARKKVAAAGLEDRISLDQADVKDLPYPERTFDTVFSNTILHHIPEPRAMLAEAWRVVKPGGLLWIRDLYRPADEETARALVEQYVGDGSERQQKLFFDSLCAGLTVTEAEATAHAAGIAGARVAMSSDRHYTLVARKESD